MSQKETTMVDKPRISLNGPLNKMPGHFYDL